MFLIGFSKCHYVSRMQSGFSKRKETQDTHNFHSFSGLESNNFDRGDLAIKYFGRDDKKKIMLQPFLRIISVQIY
jgi:hypothetical protein